MTDNRNGDDGSVEEIRMDTGATNNIHNADPREDVAAKIRALARFPVSEAEMDRVRQARRAQKNCNLCGKCGRKLDRGETVWRVYIGGLGHGIVGRIWTVAPVCGQCRPQYRRYLQEKPCENCARGVINEANERRWYRKYTVCSDRCEHEHRQSIKKQNRQQPDCVCGVCEKPFRPSRCDAVHCSNACRQRDYRRRKQKGPGGTWEQQMEMEVKRTLVDGQPHNLDWLAYSLWGIVPPERACKAFRDNGGVTSPECRDKTGRSMSLSDAVVIGIGFMVEAKLNQLGRDGLVKQCTMTNAMGDQINGWVRVGSDRPQRGQGNGT